MTLDRLNQNWMVAAVVLIATSQIAVAQSPVASPKSTTQPARIEPFEQAPLFARIDGFIIATHTVVEADTQLQKALLVDIGDRVKEGEIIAEISVPEMRQELLQKRALYAQAEAEVEQAAQSIVVAQKLAESARARVNE